jgi:hypothetical protein
LNESAHGKGAEIKITKMIKKIKNDIVKSLRMDSTAVASAASGIGATAEISAKLRHLG